MPSKKVIHYIYDTIVFMKELPYDLKSGKDSQAIKEAILKRFKAIPKKYRKNVFQALDDKGRRYDFTGHNLWEPYIRQIRNSGQGPLFQWEYIKFMFQVI